MKPVKLYTANNYFHKYFLLYNKVNVPKSYNLHEFMRCKIVEDRGPVEFAIKAKETEFANKFDMLISYEGPSFVVHKRLLALLQEVCPKDFQALQCKIVNYSKKAEPFANYDYYMINILNKVDAVDNKKSKFKDYGDGFRVLKKLHFKEDCMNGYMLARDSEFSAGELIHPELVEKIKHCSRGMKFLEDWQCYEMWDSKKEGKITE